MRVKAWSCCLITVRLQSALDVSVTGSSQWVPSVPGFLGNPCEHNIAMENRSCPVACPQVSLAQFVRSLCTVCTHWAVFESVLDSTFKWHFKKYIVIIRSAAQIKKKNKKTKRKYPPKNPNNKKPLKPNQTHMYYSKYFRVFPKLWFSSWFWRVATHSIKHWNPEGRQNIWGGTD